MNFEFSLKEVEGRLFLHSVLTLESGEKSEKDLSVPVIRLVEEAYLNPMKGMLRFSIENLLAALDCNSATPQFVEKFEWLREKLGTRLKSGERNL